MMHHILKTLLLGAALSGAVMVSPLTFAQDRTVKIIVPFPIGGSTDKVARLVAPAFAAEIGEQAVVINRGGASGTIGTAEVARAAPDGLTLGIVFDSQATNHHMFKSLPYDTFKSFEYVSLLVSSPHMLASATYKTFDELLRDAKQEPGKVSFGSTGLGTSNHLAPLMLAQQAGCTFLPVPYQGGGGTYLPDMLTGRFDFSMGSPAYFMQQVKAGKLTPLATGGTKRSPQFPDVPTVAEYFPGYEVSSWVGVIAPAGTPKAILEKYQKAFRVAVETPAIKEILMADGFIIEGSTGPEFLAKVQHESEKYGKLIRDEKLADK